MREEKVAAYLKEYCFGRRNARKSADLEKTLHLSGKDLRMLVHRLRRRAIPIASGPEGYFYAATAMEVYTTIHQLQVMAKGLDIAIRGLEQSFTAFGGDPGE